MQHVDEVRQTLRKVEDQLLDELLRVREALRALDGRPEHAPHHGSASPAARVIRLPRADRPSPNTGREAAVDDVLALVTTGVSVVSELASLLKTDRVTVRKRLHALQRDELVVCAHNRWTPTAQAQRLNWIEPRARELGRTA